MSLESDFELIKTTLHAIANHLAWPTEEKAAMIHADIDAVGGDLRADATAAETTARDLGAAVSDVQDAFSVAPALAAPAPASPTPASPTAPVASSDLPGDPLAGTSTADLEAELARRNLPS